MTDSKDPNSKKQRQRARRPESAKAAPRGPQQAQSSRRPSRVSAPTPARLIVESGGGRGETFTLDPRRRKIGIGRDAACHITVADPKASRLHCVVGFTGRGVELLDHKSANGTLVNGKRVQQHRLRDGDLIQIGDTFLTFSDTAADPLQGRVIAGYRIDRRLGRGGMGTVYLATQVSLKRQVALKILSNDLTADREFVARFLDEGRAAAKLNHPNVVQVHDTGRDGDTFYLSMEYMEGGSLQALIDRKGKLPVETILPMIADATRALIWAKQNGIVHRDIKPDNLMLDGAGRIKVCDFGIASDSRKSKTVYEGGKVIGTPLFMAPEQAMGKKVDHRADLYALGATLYYALCRKHPFDGESPLEILLKKVKENAPSISSRAENLPPELVRLVDKMIARSPAERFQDATAIYRELAVLGGAQPVRKRRDARTSGASTSGAGAAEAIAAPEAQADLPGNDTVREPRRSHLVWTSAAAVVVVFAVLAVSLFRPSLFRPSLFRPDAPSPLPSGGPVVDAPSTTPPETMGNTAPKRTAAKTVQADAEGGAANGSATENPRRSPAGGDAVARDGDGSAESAEGESAGRVSVNDDALLSPWNVDDATRRELLLIRDRALSRTIELARAEKLLDAFNERHPEEEWQRFSANVRRKLKESLDPVGSTTSPDLLEKLAADVEPRLSSGDFAAALAALAYLEDAHPLQREHLATHRDTILAQAKEAADQTQRAVEALLADGKFVAADRLVETAIKQQPETSRPELLRVREHVQKRIQVQESALLALTESEKEVRDALLRLDLEAAAAVVERSNRVLPRDLNLPRVERRQNFLQNELSLFGDTWQRLKAALTGLEGEGSTTLALAGDPKPENSRLIVTRVTGMQLTVQQRGSRRTREISVASLSNEALLRLLEGNQTTTPEMTSERAEALGVFLHYAGEPVRAWDMLHHPEIAEETRALYHERLVESFVNQISAQLDGDLDKLQALRSASSRNPDWKAISTSLAGLIRTASRLPDDVPIRADLAAAWIECERRRVLAEDLRSVFHAAKVERRPSGALRLSYTFKNDAQLLAFTPRTSPDKATLANPGTAILKGEYRFLRGNPFREELYVGGTVSRFLPAAPNVNIAMWTRPSDRLPTSASSLFSSTTSNGTSLYAYCMGYAGDTSSTINGFDVIDAPNFEDLILPANLVLTAERTNSRDGGLASSFRCRWGQKPRSGYGSANATFEISLKKDRAPIWKVNGRSLPIRDEGPGAGWGSFTLFSGKSSIALSKLYVEGKVDPSWLHNDATRLSVERLRELDPSYPYVYQRMPFETTRRGRTWHELQPGKIVFREDFTGELAAAWDIRNEDKAAYSLGKNPGTLTVATAAGDLDKDGSYKNLFLVPNPLTGDVNFSITARVLDFHPTMPYQQAGVVCFNDNTNYIKANYEASRSGPRYMLYRKIDGRAQASSVTSRKRQAALWLRIERRGNVYAFFTSVDGEVFEERTRLTWYYDPPKFVGIFAVNSRYAPPAKSIDAQFDLFELRELP